MWRRMNGTFVSMLKEKSRDAVFCCGAIRKWQTVGSTKAAPSPLCLQRRCEDDVEKLLAAQFVFLHQAFH
jgi:hypothetical protein